MIGIANAVKLPTIHIPQIMYEKFYIAGNTMITRQEALLYEKSLYMVSLQLSKEGKTDSDFSIANIIFTENLCYTFINTTGHKGGMVQNLIVYAMQTLRTYAKTDIHYYRVFLEELCHHIWRIEDETVVLYKVLEILKNNNINVNMADIIF